MSKAADRYPLDTPDTKEAYFIRQSFESGFTPDLPAYASASHNFLVPQAGSRVTRQRRQQFDGFLELIGVARQMCV